MKAASFKTQLFFYRDVPPILSGCGFINPDCFTILLQHHFLLIKINAVLVSSANERAILPKAFS
jgi:hypothetical protein